jgi:HSP20 family molecular chaperone IbpA
MIYRRPHCLRRNLPLTGHLPFAGKTPCADEINRESDFLIRAELPGVEKNDIHITLANNMLTVEAV